jgi:hypothetical protein
MSSYKNQIYSGAISSHAPWSLKNNSLASQRNLISPWRDTELRQTSQTDLLAISAHLYRRHKDVPMLRFVDLIGASRHLVIDDKDRRRAEEIADYFGKQIVLAQLRGTVTDFQKAMGSFLATDRLTLEHREQGMIHRLPEYYENDMKMLEIRDTYFADHQYITVCEDDSRYNPTTRTLIPIDTVERNTRNSKVVQYWFKDSMTGNPAMLTVDVGNQLKYMWDRMFNTQLNGIVVTAAFMNHEHAILKNYTWGKKWTVN